MFSFFFVYFCSIKYSNMTSEDALTIKAVLLYIINRNKDDRRDVYSIVKTAYYAQQLHFAKWALPIYDDRIAALPFGPVPSDIYNILRLARGEDTTRFLKKSGLEDIAKSIDFDNETFIAKEDADTKYLSPSARECLDEAIAKVAGMNFNDIVKDTHGKEWNRAYHNSSSKFMDDLNIAREGGADDSIVEYLRENLELNKCFA